VLFCKPLREIECSGLATLLMLWKVRFVIVFGIYDVVLHIFGYFRNIYFLL